MRNGSHMYRQTFGISEVSIQNFVPELEGVTTGL